MSNGGKNVGEAIGTIILGIVGGMALAALVDYLTGYQCPVCQQRIRRSMSRCPNCHSELRWDVR